MLMIMKVADVTMKVRMMEIRMEMLMIMNCQFGKVKVMMVKMLGGGSECDDDDEDDDEDDDDQCCLHQLYHINLLEL